MENYKSMEECTEMAEKIHAKAKELEELAHQAENEFGLRVRVVEKFSDFLSDPSLKRIRMSVSKYFPKPKEEQES